MQRSQKSIVRNPCSLGLRPTHDQIPGPLLISVCPEATSSNSMSLCPLSHKLGVTTLIPKDKPPHLPAGGGVATGI